MAMRRPGSRAFRPSTEGLESRKLLAKVLTGIDIDGDVWELRLNGPGDLSVINQPDDDGLPIPLGEPALIEQINIGGADPYQTELRGRVTPAEGGDGRVFFQQLTEVGSQPVARENFNGNGIHAIDMPDFWLGYTGTEAPPVGTPGSGTPAASIDIPNGVMTLRFGGVDTSFAAPGRTPLDQDAANSVMQVNLGLPFTNGTSIIVDRVVSSGQPPVGAVPTAQPTQDSVVFAVGGRLNLFQANAIEGDSDVVPAQFANINPEASESGVGGTYVISGSGTPPFLTTGSTQGGVTGQIGNLRIGGDATNLTALVFDDTGSAGAKISNFYIGGETDNVILSAPDGARNLSFGRGMDRVEILSQTIAHLLANRGALSSRVVTTGQIGQMLVGGDVDSTQVLSGYDQNFTTITSLLRFSGAATEGPALTGGRIKNLLIAGDVVDSIFAASVEPFNGAYGVEEALELPSGSIGAKVEGTIDNLFGQPDTPDQAFFADRVHLARGPVVPPSVPEPPYPHPGAAPHGPRLAKHLFPTDPDAPSRRVPIRPGALGRR